MGRGDERVGGGTEPSGMSWLEVSSRRGLLLLTSLGALLALAGAVLAMDARSLGGRRPRPEGEQERVRVASTLPVPSPPAQVTVAQVAAAQVAPPPRPGPCPDEMALVELATVGRFCIDRWEAHVLVPDGDGLRLHPGNEPVDGLTSFRAASAAGVVPQAYISGEQSSAACQAAGKRLCRAVEWKLACHGPEPASYPYGARRIAGACQDTRFPHPFAELFGDNRPEMFDRAHLNDPRLDLLPNTVLPAGSKPQCVSSYGVHDQVGNLHEWIDDPEGTFLGGYFVEAQVHGLGCNYITTAHRFDYHDYSTGFRCCREAEEG